MNDTDVVIVGGGISGLATAWWLARKGLSVQVWESSHRTGGKIRSRQQDGYLTEQAASLLLNFRPEVAQLVHEAGLDEAKTARREAAAARRYLLHHGRLQAVPMRLGAMLTSPLWSLRGKLRLLLEPFIPPGTDEDESVSRFISRRLGSEMLEKAMEPFVAGTLAADPDLASAAATLPRLAALERRYGSLTAGILVHRLLRRRTACSTDSFSFLGGMATLVDTLADTPGVQVHRDFRVEELLPTRHGWRISAATPHGERCLSAANVVLATPAPNAAALLSPLDRELADLLAGIDYAPLAVLHMGLARHHVAHPLDGTGFLTPRREGQVFNGNLWMSSLFAGRAPAGKILLTTYLGGARNPGVVDWEETRLAGEALRALTPILGLKGDPEMLRSDRLVQALPLYHGAYLARKRAMDQRLRALPGLHLAANYRGGVSVRDRIARGRLLAREIAAARHAAVQGRSVLLAPSLPVDY